MHRFEHASMMDQAESLAISVGNALDAAIKLRGWAVLAVSGGRSPIAMFERLRYRPVRWDAVTITLVDERAVPAGHPDSNGDLVRTHLLREAAAAAAFVPLIADAAEAATPALAVARLNAAYRQPDVAVLGMGEDGAARACHAQPRRVARHRTRVSCHCRRDQGGRVRPRAPGRVGRFAGGAGGKPPSARFRRVRCMTSCPLHATPHATLHATSPAR
jgi:hypothetical protein